MLIVSKFHDYYDSALSGGVDKTIVYERHTIEDEIEAKIDNDFYPHIPLHDYFNRIIIGFCGKMYYGLQPDPTMFTDEEKEFSKVTYWSTKELLSQKVFHNRFDKVLDKDANRYSRWANWEDNTIRQEIDRFFAGNATEKYSHIFTDNKLVCFRATPAGSYTTYLRQVHRDISKRTLAIIINPELKPLNFVKVIDPYTALQEIMMYISGVLGSPNRPMVQIGDIDILEGKGFDKKTSFRRGPTKQAKHEKRRKR